MSVAFLPGAEAQDGGLMLAPGKWHDPADHRSILETAVQSGDFGHTGEGWTAVDRAMTFDAASTARVRAQEEAYRSMADKVRKATGEVLDDPTLRNTPEIVRRINQGEFTGFNDPRLGELMTQRQDAFLERVAALKSQNPDKLADVDPFKSIQSQGMDVSRQAREAQARFMAREDVGWLAKGVAMVGGSISGGASAPENLLALAAPGGGAGATFLRRLASSSLAGAGGGALGAAAAQPDAQAYKRDQGLDYGWADAAKETAMGAAMGAAIGGGLHTAGEGIGRLVGRLFAKGATEADLAAAVRATGREPTPDELASFGQAKAADAGDAATAAHLADIPADRRQAGASEALAALNDPTAAGPGRELRAPPEWQDSAARAATTGAKTFDEAVDALRGRNAALSAIASGDPQLRAAGYVASLDDAALARVRELGVPPEHAAQIARKSGDGATQAELAQLLSEAKATTVAEVKMVLDDHLAAKFAPEAAAARIGRPLAEGPLAPHRVVDADGRAVVVRPVLIEAADLRTSGHPDFPKILQPRDRTRVASTQQIREMATRLDPERLGKSAEADRGAPIVGPDRVVESGNGRVAAIRDAYAQGGEAADSYRAWLQKQGLDIDGMKEPVLARIRETPLDDAERAAFTLAANKATTLDLSAAERALADARMLDADMLAAIATPDLAAPANAEFARAFVGRLPQSEQGRMVTATGQLAPDGLDRIRKALAARAYGDSPVLARLADSIDDDVRGLSVALMHAAPDWARMRAEIAAGRVRPEMDVTPELVRAVDEAAQLRGRGQTLADRLAQLDAFEPRDGVVDAFLRLFYDEKGARPAASRRVADAVRFYADEARQVCAAAETAFLAPAEATDVLAAWFRREGVDYAVSKERIPAESSAAPGYAANGAGAHDAAGGAGASGRIADAGGGAGDGAGLDAQAPPGRGAGDPQGSVGDHGALAAGGRDGAGAGGDARAAGELAGSAQDQTAAGLTRQPDRALDARPDDLFDPADLRASWIADVVKACKA